MYIHQESNWLCGFPGGGGDFGTWARMVVYFQAVWGAGDRVKCLGF